MNRLLLIVLLATGGAIGVYAGHARMVPSASTRLRPGIAVGEVLPRAVVNSSSRGAVRLQDLIDSSLSTVVVVFSLGCTKCLAEAEEWQQLATQHSKSRHFIGIASGKTFAELEAFQRLANLQFPVWLSDRELISTLDISTPPAIYEVYNGRVTFSAAGANASEALGRYLALVDGSKH
jgi:thiol-disulfide isomerase/thioredoxin